MLYSRTLLFILSLYNSLHLLIPNSQSIPPPSQPGQPQVRSLCLWVYFCFVDKFICVILDSIYKQYHMVFVFLCLTYFTQYDNLWVHPCCCRWHYFILFSGWLIFHCIHVPHILYPKWGWFFSHEIVTKHNEIAQETGDCPGRLTTDGRHCYDFQHDQHQCLY